MTERFPTPWRHGHKVPRNVYDADDEPVIMAPDEETAERIVRAVNLAERDLERAKKATKMLGAALEEQAEAHRKAVERLRLGVEAAIRMVSPDHITPVGAQQIRVAMRVEETR